MAAARDECIAWKDGRRFPVDDHLYATLGVAVRERFDLWWAAIRELTRRAASADEITNLSYVLAAALEEVDTLAAHIRDEAVRDYRLAALLAEAVRHAWMGDDGTAELHVRDLFGVEFIVSTYLRYQRTGDEIDFWAWEIVSGLVSEARDEAWLMLLAIIDAADDDDEVLGCVGAGPLEDFVSSYGPDYLDEIEREAALRPGLRSALSAMWVWDDLPAVAFERIAKAAQGNLDRPASLVEASQRRASHRRFNDLSQRAQDALEAGDMESASDAITDLNAFLGIEEHD